MRTIDAVVLVRAVQLQDMLEWTAEQLAHINDELMTNH